MPSILLSDNGVSSGSAGLKSTAASDGALAIQTTTAGGTATTAISIDTSQAVTMAGRTTNPTTISVGGATPSTSGAGISFPATQVASSDANTLDDYEEGTFTPTDASGAGLTLTVTQASYIKIGGLVYVQFYITYPSTANTNTAQIGGLPFIAGGGYGMLYGRWQGTTFQARQYQVNTGATTAILRGSGGGVNITNANISGEYILVSGCYSVL